MMGKLKKFVLFAGFFLGAGVLVFSQDAGVTGQADAAGESGADVSVAEPDDSEAGDSGKERKWPSWMDTKEADVRTGFRAKRTIWEVGLANTNLGFSNTWLGLGDMVGLINGDAFNIKDYLDSGKELDLEFGMVASPLNVRVTFASFTLNVVTGVEADMRLDTDGDIIKNLTKMQKLLPDIATAIKNSSSLDSLNAQINALNGKITAEGEAYAFVDITGEKRFFNEKLFIKAGPAVFAPIFYMPRQSVEMYGSAPGSNYNPANDAAVYKFGTSGGIDSWTAQGAGAIGVDLSVEGRYAIWPILDAGLSVTNIPVVPAFMRKKTHLDPVSFSATIPKASDVLAGSSPELEGDVDVKTMMDNLKNGSNSTKAVMRPLRFDFYGLYKPFKSSLILVRPDIGFSIKYMGSGAYTTLNWGVEGQVNFPVVLSVAVGIKEFEEAWSNYITLILGFRAFEFDLGFGLRGPNFKDSWSGKGMNVVAGIKFGW